MNTMKTLFENMRSVFARPAPAPAPAPALAVATLSAGSQCSLQCNYSDDYYGDKVCVIKCAP